MRREEWDDYGIEGLDERTSLDQPSKFTLTKFRRSKWTQLFSWVITMLGFWN
jgi:hypothetical protein